MEDGYYRKLYNDGMSISEANRGSELIWDLRDLVYDYASLTWGSLPGDYEEEKAEVIENFRIAWEDAKQFGLDMKYIENEIREHGPNAGICLLDLVK